MTCEETDEEIIDEGLDDEDDEAKEQEEEEEKPSVDVLGSSIPYQVVNDSLYLEKKSVFQLLALTSKQPGYPSRHGYRQELSGLMMSMLMTIFSNSSFCDKKVACSTMLEYNLHKG